MTENDLVDKLAELEYDQGENGLWESACREVKAIYWQHVTKDFLPIIRSYANALVAGAIEECKQACVINRDSCGDSHTDCHRSDANCMSFITPESAAKELERIKNEARMEEAKWWHSQRGHHGSPNWCCERVTALEAAKEK